MEFPRMRVFIIGLLIFIVEKKKKRQKNDENERKNEVDNCSILFNAKRNIYF